MWKGINEYKICRKSVKDLIYEITVHRMRVVTYTGGGEGAAKGIPKFLTIVKHVCTV